MKSKNGETPKSRYKGVSYHRPTGKWFGRKRITGKPDITTGYYDSQDEANRALKLAIHESEVLSAERPTVERFLEEWFDYIKPDGPNTERPKVRQTTYNARYYALAMLLPDSMVTGKWSHDKAFTSFRGQFIKDFRDVDLRSFLAKLKKHGVQTRSVQMAYEALRASWRYAVERHYVEKSNSPFVSVARPPHEAKEKPAITDADHKRLLDAILAMPNRRDKTLLFLLAEVGLRISEAIAIKWSSVDFEKREIRIDAQLSDDGELVPLKTRESRRTVAITNQVRDLLAQLKVEAESEWVFETSSLGPVNRHNARTKALQPVLERAELDHLGITLHRLRSIAATSVAFHGATPEALTKHFGWSSMAVAMKFYVRDSEAGRDMMRAAMDRAADRLTGMTSAEPAVRCIPHADECLDAPALTIVQE